MIIKEREIVNLGTEEDKNELQIVDNLEWEVVIAWSYKDMSGLDPDIASHKILLCPDAKPKKQKLRRMQSDMSLKIKEEVTKQLKVDFAEISKHSKWVADGIPILKKDGK